MSKTESRADDDGGEASEQPAGRADPEMSGPGAYHETVDPETREAVLERDEYRCRACGRRAPERGGLASLQVHHIERDPDGMGEHDLANLTTLCRSCHNWLHQQATRSDAPVELTDEDLRVLLPQDIEVLRFLAASGPARTGEIAGAVTADLTVSAVRERLWVLMGLDNLVEDRDRQIVDKDVETGEWGVTEQVETSARGHIPDDPQLLLQRMEDEQVRQALDRGCDRSTIMTVFDVSRRTTFNKQKRAAAYDFPLDAFYNRGGRPTSSSERSDRSPATTGKVEDAGDEQQRLDAVPEEDPDSLGRTETWGDSDASDAGSTTNKTRAENGGEASSTVQSDVDVEAIHRELQSVLAALQAVDDAL